MQSDHFPALINFINSHKTFLSTDLRKAIGCEDDPFDKTEPSRAIRTLLERLKKKDAIHTVKLIKVPQQKATIAQYRRLRRVTLKDLDSRVERDW